MGSSASIRGLWPYEDTSGTRWLLIYSSDTLYGWHGSSVSTLATGLHATNDVDGAQGLGNFYIVNKATNVIQFDGSSVSYLSNSPIAGLIESWRNRIVLADISGSQSTLALSGELEPNDWTAFDLSTSPVYWRVGGVNDAANQVTGLSCGYRDFCQVFTGEKFYGFFGHDQRNFVLRLLWNNAGAVDDRTIQTRKNVLEWLSRNGVERFNGNVLADPRPSHFISQEIRDAVNLEGDVIQWLQTTQAHFEDGTSVDVSTSISVGTVELSTWSMTETSDADFSNGTLVGLDTTTLSGSVALAMTNADVEGNTMVGGAGPGNPNWNTTGAALAVNIHVSQDVDGVGDGYSLNGGFSDPCSALGVTARLRNYSDDSVLTSGSTGNSLQDENQFDIDPSDWLEFTLDFTSDGNRYAYLEFEVDGAGSAGTVFSDPFFTSSASVVSYWVLPVNSGSGFCSMEITWVENGRNSVTTGTYTSQAYDAILSTPIWLAVDYTEQANGHDSTFWIQVATSNTGDWGSSETLTSGSYPTLSSKQYIRYGFNVTRSTTGTDTYYFNDATLGAREQDGSYTSAAHQTSADIQGWENMEATFAEAGGTIDFYIRAASDTASLASTSWTAVTPFTTPSIATNAYVQWRSSFSITYSTARPQVYDVTIAYNTGLDRPTSLAGVFRDRYHLFYSTEATDTSFNTKVAVNDRNGEWTFFENIHAASVAKYRNKFYFGDADSSGKVFQLYSGNNDDGSNIDFNIETKDYDFGDPDLYKMFDYAYVTAVHEAEEGFDVSIDFSYRIDGSTDTYSLGSVTMGENVGRISQKIPFPMDSNLLLEGKWLSIIMSGSVDRELSILGLSLYGVKELEPR